MAKVRDEIIKNYLKKSKLVEKYNKFYYAKDSPKVTDYEYDKKKQELIKLEKNNPFLKKYSTVTKNVGFKASDKFKKIKHTKPMLSLANAFDIEDIKDFIKKIKNYLNNKDINFSFSLEPKIDGISASLTYENGKLVKGLSRDLN